MRAVIETQTQDPPNHDRQNPFQPARSIDFYLRSRDITGLRRHRARIALRKHLLGLDDHILRDIGLVRLNLMDGSF